MATLLIGVLAVAFVVFLIARAFFGPGVAVVLTAVVGHGLGGPAGGAVGIVTGLVMLGVSSVLGAAIGDGAPPRE
jgi:hypothetical protein